MDRAELAGTFFWMLVLLAAVVPLYLRRRGRTRNRAGHCARCDGPLPWENRFRAQGLLLCAACAQVTQRRVRVAALGMGLLSVTSILLGIWAAISLHAQGDPSWWVAFVIITGCGVGLLLLTRFAIWRMGADNRQAIAAERASYLIRLLGMDKIRSEKNRPFD
jgi:hypothetical protein